MSIDPFFLPALAMLLFALPTSRAARQEGL
jgi:hypothetical protein